MSKYIKAGQHTRTGYLIDAATAAAYNDLTDRIDALPTGCSTSRAALVDRRARLLKNLARTAPHHRQH